MLYLGTTEEERHHMKSHCLKEETSQWTSFFHYYNSVPVFIGLLMPC